MTESSLRDEVLDQVFAHEGSPMVRLAPERSLADSQGVSRGAVRELMAALSSQGFVEARQGSGISILPARQWTVAAIPDYVRWAIRHGRLADLVGLLDEFLRQRRDLLVSSFATTARDRRANALDPAEMERQVQGIWGYRGDVTEFARREVDFYRSFFWDCGLKLTVWNLNTVAPVYFDLLQLLPVDSCRNMAPGDFLEPLTATIHAAIEGNEATARDQITHLIDASDRRVRSQTAPDPTAKPGPVPPAKPR